MSVRKMVTKSRKRVVGYLSNAKNNALIPWESQLERDYLRLLEADPQVLGFRAQPEWLHYVARGERHSYVPDIEVWTADRVFIDEVKTDTDAADAENCEMFGLFASIYAGRGYGCRVVVESEIRRQPRLGNVERLLRYRRHQPQPDLLWRLEQAFRGGRVSTLARATVEAERYGDGWAGIAVVLLHGALSIDIDRPLAPDTVIQFSHRKVSAR